jgi:hypothetical protein
MKTIQSPVCITIVCLLAAFRLLAAEAVGEATHGVVSTAAIQVHGELVWKRLVDGQFSGSNVVTRFSVMQNGCEYRMDETGHPTAHRQSLYCDGTNWYSELIPPDNFRATNISRMKVSEEGELITVTTPLDKPIKPKSSLTVSPTVEPMLPRFTSLLPVWLAFGGGCHFARETAPEIPSMFPLVPGPLSRVVILKADRVLRTDGNLESYTDYWDAHFFRPPQPSAAGLTNIAFQVITWTNIGAINIPATFRFTRYFFSPQRKPRFYQNMDGLGRVTKVERLGGSVTFSPTIARNTRVVHFRSQGGEPVVYPAKDARLKTQDEVDAME